MKAKKIIKLTASLIIFITIYIGFIALIGYEWDKSPTVIYQKGR